MGEKKLMMAIAVVMASGSDFGFCWQAAAATTSVWSGERQWLQNQVGTLLLSFSLFSFSFVFLQPDANPFFFLQPAARPFHSFSFFFFSKQKNITESLDFGQFSRNLEILSDIPDFDRTGLNSGPNFFEGVIRSVFIAEPKSFGDFGRTEPNLLTMVLQPVY